MGHWLVTHFQNDLPFKSLLQCGEGWSFCQYFSSMVHVGESCHHLSSHHVTGVVNTPTTVWFVETMNSQNFSSVHSLAMKCVIDSLSCLIVWKFCWWTSLWSLFTTTSLMCCNNWSSVAEFSVLAPCRSNSSLFSSGVHATLSLFRIMSMFVSRHISLYQPHVSINRAQSTSEESCSIVGLLGFYTWLYLLGLSWIPCFLCSVFSLCSFLSCCINCKYGGASIVVGSSVWSSIISNPVCCSM